MKLSREVAALLISALDPLRAELFFRPLTSTAWWCNGSTGDFDSPSHGSNPCRAAKTRRVLATGHRENLSSTTERTEGDGSTAGRTRSPERSESIHAGRSHRGDNGRNATVGRMRLPLGERTAQLFRKRVAPCEEVRLDAGGILVRVQQKQMLRIERDQLGAGARPAGDNARCYPVIASFDIAEFRTSALRREGRFQSCSASHVCRRSHATLIARGSSQEPIQGPRAKS